MSDCYLKGSPDDLLEVDRMMVANITNVTMKQSRGLAATIRNYGYTLDAVPPAEGSTLVTYNHCAFERGTRGAGAAGFGMGGEMGLYHSTFTVVYNDCWSIDPNGVETPYIGP